MPEYLPTPQPNQGLSEALVRLTSQPKPSPFQAFIQGFGPTFGPLFAQAQMKKAEAQKQQDLEDQRTKAASELEDKKLKGQKELEAMKDQYPLSEAISLGLVPAQLPGIPNGKGGFQLAMDSPDAQLVSSDQVLPQMVHSKAVHDLSEMRAKAAADQKGQVHITQEMIDKNPDLKNKGITPGMYPSSFASSLMKPPSSQQQNALSPEEWSAIGPAVQDGRIPTDLLRSRGPQLKVVAQQLLQNPSFDPRSANIDYAAGKAGATKTAAESASIKTNLGSAHKAFTTVMDKAADLAKKMGQGKLATFNQAVQAGKRQFNDLDSIQFLAYMDQAAGNYGRINKGGAASISDKDKEDALKFLSTKLNEGGIKAVKEAVETEYQGRISGLPGSGSNQKVDEKDPLGIR